MTIKLPEKSVGDKLLALFGKQRAVYIPSDIYKKYGPYVYAQAEKESFWRALFRSSNQDPPEGWFYPEKFIGKEE